MRRKLVEAGSFEEALRLPLGYFGTVHAVCLRWLQEFALDAGLSPNIGVIAGDETVCLRQALERAVPSELGERLDRLAARFQLRYDARRRRSDWLTPVGDIMDLARGNDIAPGTLAAMALRSADGLLSLLPDPIADSAGLEATLARELAAAKLALENPTDSTKKTREVRETVASAIPRLEDSELDWSDWAKLSLLDPGKSSKDAVARVREVASNYERHPRLHAEIRALTCALFEAAAIGLEAYAAWKVEHRVVDYVDMLVGAHRLLDHERVARELSSRLRFVVVDEFQDTSPIQLTLFVKLHALAGRSVWVGDRKQCVFEYAGADPLLMDAVAAWVAASGGERDTLRQNYRSRPELVRFCSELFSAAFARHGFTRDEVAASPHRAEPTGEALVPPLGLWCLESKSQEDDGECIAHGVARLLATPSGTQIVDRTTRQVRALRAGDIAVLVATNAQASTIAAALHARDVRVAVARAGLLATPEGTLVDAALRLLIDEGDSLAAATLDGLHGYAGRDPDAWLADRVIGKPAAPSVWRTAIGQVREKLAMLSPSEAIDEVLTALDAVFLAARWPDPTQRVANLDALRALAAAYEKRCAQANGAATVAGLLCHFDRMRTVALRRDEELASDEQHVPTDDGAVTVCTYHKSKGLEWPVVVLGSLERRERRHAFEVNPETDRATFDPRDPLAARWIRYWPWPFGQRTQLPLRVAAEQSEPGKRVGMREEKERVRLLYVGLTRARDHLVFALRSTKTGGESQWLDALTSAGGEPLLELPIDGSDQTTAVARVRACAESDGAEVAARVWRLSANRPDRGLGKNECRWFARPPVPIDELPSYGITPSSAAKDWAELTLPGIRRIVMLPASIPLDAKLARYDELGDSVHAFLAADTPELRPAERLERAGRLILAAGLNEVIRADAVVGASDRLRNFIEARWPGATWWREVPIEALVDTPDGTRRVSGTIDLLLDTHEGFVLIDHKMFPGASEGAWLKKTREVLPQLAAYIAVLRMIPGAKVVGCWVHLPVGGAMVELGV